MADDARKKEVEHEIASAWLDTETKAFLQPTPPMRLAPSSIDTFTLVLLRKGKDAARVLHSLTKIPGLPDDQALWIATSPCPVPIVGSLSVAEAILGQFELVCADSISIFLRDEIVLSPANGNLPDICSQFLSSSEFGEVAIDVTMIPRTAEGERFVEQFLGDAARASFCADRGYFFRGKAMRKKARIMAHWAEKIGAVAKFGNSTDDH